MAEKARLNKHEREAADLVIEVLGSGRLDSEVTEGAADYSMSENAKGIDDWDKVDEDRVFASKAVQSRLRSIVADALSGLKP